MIEAIPDSLTFAGEWWTPEQVGAEQEPKLVPGVLNWKDQSATLELHTALVPMRGVVFEYDQQTYSVIHGATTRSKLLTVLNAIRVSAPMSFGSPGLRESEHLQSSWVVLGVHVTAQTVFT